MKELSIEEKAKRYDEVVAIAKECITHIPDEAVNKYMLNMFPELKEPEDEKIRKQIISFLKEFEHDHYRSLDFSSWIAWLEKQGEQKPVDKVEPKFNLYDWVATDKGDVVQIGAVNNGYYTLFNGMDFDMSYVDKYWHKWTIQDAKDGDVLATKDNRICIFDNTVEEGKHPFAYCGLSIYGFEVYDRTLPFTHLDVYPATKEQHDLLFAKMHEAGYEWNSDKKVVNMEKGK